MQAGLRYEYTSYDANQLGNSVRKDSCLFTQLPGIVSIWLYQLPGLTLPMGSPLRVDAGSIVPLFRN
jgi:hypothetical protein